MRRHILAFTSVAALIALLAIAPVIAQQAEKQADQQAGKQEDKSAKKKKAKSEDESSQDKNHEADKLFGLDKVWTVHLKISPEAYKALDPPNAPGRFGPGAPPRFRREDAPNNPRPDQAPSQAPAQDRLIPRGPGGPGGPGPMGGIEFPEVKATVEFDGQTLEEVGLRYKGNSTFMASRNTPKKSFKLDFNQFVKKQKLLGLTKLNLNNNALDASQIREAVSYEIFRQAGVPAPRTAFARVYLTVTGEQEKKYLGMYTVIEQVDEKFLQNHFASKDGLLLKPERIGELPYYGDDWSKYAKPYDAKNDGTPAATKRFMALARLINNATDEEFREQIRSFINVNAFARFLALNGLMVNMDSILAMGQNYYIYHDATEDQFHWIPWDLNMSFGGFPSGSPEQMMSLSIAHPHAGKHALIDRLLAVPEIKKAYMEQVRELTAQVFTIANISAVIEKIKATARPAIADESKLALEQFDKMMQETMPEKGSTRPDNPAPGGPVGFGGPMMMGGGTPLKPFIARRIESVRHQLAGKSEGYTPTNFGPGGGRGFGPGRGPEGGFGPGGPPPGGGMMGGVMVFEPGGFLALQLLEAADKNKDGKLTQLEFTDAAGHWFTEWDTAKKRSLTVEELGYGLNQFFGPPPGFGPPGTAPEGGAPPPSMFGGGPGSLIATALLQSADANRDSKLTQIEFKTGIAKWFAQWDKDKTRTLEEKEISQGLGQVLPAPPGFESPIEPPANQPATQSKKAASPAKTKSRKSK